MRIFQSLLDKNITSTTSYEACSVETQLKNEETEETNLQSKVCFNFSPISFMKNDLQKLCEVKIWT